MVSYELSLFVVHCVLRVACRVLFVVAGWLLAAACLSLLDVCELVFIVCGVLFVVCWWLFGLYVFVV